MAAGGWWRVAVFAVALGACGGETNGGTRPTGAAPIDCDAVRFADPALEAAVRAELQRPTGALTAAELASARSVLVRGAHSLSGLECLTHLVYLTADGGDFASLAPIAGLLDLEVVVVIGSQVRSLAPLAGLPKLSDVSFTHGEVSDLTPLGQIPTLRRVVLQGKITDVTPLAALSGLEILEIYGHPLSDVGPLRDFPKLTRLKLEDMPITTFDVEAPELVELSLYATLLSDVTPITRYPRLRSIDVSYTPLTDLSPLSGFAPPPDVDCPTFKVDHTPVGQIFSSDETLWELCRLGWVVSMTSDHAGLYTCHEECLKP